MTTAAGSSDRMPRTRLPRNQRGQQLLDVAEGLFSDRGFKDTSMEDVARAAGVTRTVVYGHYPTKEALFVACVERARTDLECRLGDLISLDKGIAVMGEAFERVVDVFFQILEQDPGRWAMLYSSGPGSSEDIVNQMATLRQNTANRIADVISHYVPDMEYDRSRAYAHAISGVTEQLGSWWLANPAISRERIVTLCHDFIMVGFSPWVEGSHRPGSASKSPATTKTQAEAACAAAERPARVKSI